MRNVHSRKQKASVVRLQRPWKYRLPKNPKDVDVSIVLEIVAEQLTICLIRSPRPIFLERRPYPNITLYALT